MIVMDAFALPVQGQCGDMRCWIHSQALKRVWALRRKPSAMLLLTKICWRRSVHLPTLFLGSLFILGLSLSTQYIVFARLPHSFCDVCSKFVGGAPWECDGLVPQPSRIWLLAVGHRCHHAASQPGRPGSISRHCGLFVCYCVVFLFFVWRFLTDTSFFFSFSSFSLSLRYVSLWFSLPP